jgi:hypothetical protein
MSDIDMEKIVFTCHACHLVFIGYQAFEDHLIDYCLYLQRLKKSEKL